MGEGPKILEICCLKTIIIKSENFKNESYVTKSNFFMIKNELS